MLMAEYRFKLLGTSKMFLISKKMYLF